MQEKSSQNDTFFVFERLKSVYQLKNNTALADFFEVKPQSISTMLKRQSVPYETIVAKCDKKHLPYILFGIEEKTSDFSEKEEKNDFLEDNREQYSGRIQRYCSHMEEEIKYLRKQIELKDEMIDMYHTGQIVVVIPKESKR